MGGRKKTDIEFQDKLIKNVLYYMKEKNIDIDILSEKSGISKARLKTILKIGAIRCVSVEELLHIADVLNISMDQIYDV